MKPKTLLILISLLSTILSSGCACGYQSVWNENHATQSNTEIKNIQIDYNPQALTNPFKRVNKRYINKSYKHGIYMSLFQITNSSENNLIVGDNLVIKDSNNNQVELVEPNYAYKKLKQKSPAYLLYSLLIVSFRSCQNGDCIVVPLPVGTAIAIGNTLSAAKANKTFKNEIVNQNLIGKVIEPGQTIKGTLCSTSKLNNVSFELEKN